MKHIHFDIKGDGFYGAYWVCKDGSDCAVIAMLGDDPEDYMARSAVKWLLRLGVNVLTNYMAQIARQRKDRHCGGINDCNSRPDGGFAIWRYLSKHRNDAQ